MEKSRLVPFVRKGLQILFVGMNPATGSSQKGHYFSVNQRFWDQLYLSGLIMTRVDKKNADELIFGGTTTNLNGWSYGITDLVPETAESDSSLVNSTIFHCEQLKDTIMKFDPRVVVLFQFKVQRKFLKFLDRPKYDTNFGMIGKIIPGCNSMFFNVAFPHGNSILDDLKILRYNDINSYLTELTKASSSL